MKWNNTVPRSGLALIVALAGTCLATNTAAAQDAAKRPDSSGQNSTTTIVIYDNGAMTVNGTAVEPESGPTHMKLGDQDVVIIRRNDHGVLLPPGDAIKMKLRNGDVFDGLNPEDLDQALDALKSADFTKRIRPLFGDVAFLARENSETIRMEQEARDLARRARNAEGAEQEQLKRQLHDKLNAEFDQKLALSRDRVEHLQKDLKDEQERLEKRQRARDEIIERHMNELLGEGDVLDW